MRTPLAFLLGLVLSGVSAFSQTFSWPSPRKQIGQKHALPVYPQDGQEYEISITPQPKSDSPNGFLALAVYDKPENCGNGDGFIDDRDEIYSKLRIWVDANHNGLSEPEELHTLHDLGIGRIDLQYQVKPRTDEFGNEFYLRSRVWDLNGVQGGRWAWDVYFRRDP